MNQIYMQIKFKNGKHFFHLIVNSPNEFRGVVVVGETVEARCRSSSISSAVLLCSVVGAAARNREPVLDFACCQPKAVSSSAETEKVQLRY